MKLSKDEILGKVQADIKQAENYYSTYLEPKILKAYQLYNADKDYYKKKFPKLSSRSSIVSRDIYAAVKWIMPSLMRIFFGSEDVVSIKGRTVEDDRQAEIMQKLINFQIQRENPGFLLFYKWMEEALIVGYGVLKAYWVRETKNDEITEVVALEELQLLQNAKNVQIVSADLLENGEYYRVRYKVNRLLKNKPVLEVIHPSEFIFDPNAKTIKDSPFVAHRKIVTVDYLRRRAKEGWYDAKAVEEAAKTASSIEQTIDSVTSYLQPYRYDYTETTDEARNKVLLYECYTKLDVNGDGLLEDVIVTVANNQILRVQQNIYGRPPFFVIVPNIEPYQIVGTGLAEILEDIQDLKTAIKRQLLVSIGLNNDPKMFINEEAVEIEDIINDRSFIRIRGNIPPTQAVYPYPHRPADATSFSFLEYMEVEKENTVGVTRYSQGLDSRSLNKTATGISLIMQASTQRIELIARSFAETGIKELFEFLVELNQRFIDQETVIRLTNETLVIRPDDIKGEFDLIVNAGVGLAAKETLLKNLQTLLQMYPDLMKLGVATPKNVYYAMKKYIEALGFKDVDKLITDPEGGQIGQVTAPTGGIPAGVENAGAPAGLQELLATMQAGDISGMAGESGGGMATPEGATGGVTEA